MASCRNFYGLMSICFPGLSISEIRKDTRARSNSLYGYAPSPAPAVGGEADEKVLPILFGLLSEFRFRKWFIMALALFLGSCFGLGFLFSEIRIRESDIRIRIKE